MRTQVRDRAARYAKLEALQAQLGEAVAALVTGEDWKRALTFAAQFRSRSFNNTMLIYVQHHAAYVEGRVPEPIPTHVAGFKQWMSLGRHVMKGQHGYGILAPVTARFASSPPPTRSRGGDWLGQNGPGPGKWCGQGWWGSSRPTSGMSRRPTATRSRSSHGRCC